MRRALAKKRKAATAVLVFKASTDLFQESDGKTFPDDCEEWKSVVTFFRSQKGQFESSARLSRQEKQRYKKLKYIFGPMSGDGLNVSVSQNNENCIFLKSFWFQARNPEWVPTPILPLKFQLCIRDEGLAEEFYDGGVNIEKVVFFQD